MGSKVLGFAWIVGGTLIAGCALPFALPRAGGIGQIQAASEPQVQPIVGSVDFGVSGFKAQTNMGDIANAATVSLIDTAKNETVSTTKTTAEGEFVLSFGGWVPEAGAVYILEGVKGLDFNRPSSPAARVRTLVRSSGGGWETITAGRMTINISSTALAIMWGIYKKKDNPPRDRSDAAKYLGLIASPATEAGKSDPLIPGQEVVVQEVYELVYGFVTTAIKGDKDPVASTKYTDAGNFETEAGTGPRITGISPEIGTGGTPVKIFGSNFKAAPGSNIVYFNEIQTFPTSASETDLGVQVPPGATSGFLKVKTVDGESATVSFAVISGFDGSFKAN